MFHGLLLIARPPAPSPRRASGPFSPPPGNRAPKAATAAGPLPLARKARPRWLPNFLQSIPAELGQADGEVDAPRNRRSSGEWKNGRSRGRRWQNGAVRRVRGPRMSPNPWHGISCTASASQPATRIIGDGVKIFRSFCAGRAHRADETATPSPPFAHRPGACPSEEYPIQKKLRWREEEP
jgi:hypothetical protein